MTRNTNFKVKNSHCEVLVFFRRPRRWLSHTTCTIQPPPLGPGGASASAASKKKMGIFARFAVFWQGLEMGSCHGEGSLQLPRKSKVQPPPPGGGGWTFQKVQGPNPPSWRVPWTFEKVQRLGRGGTRSKGGGA